MATELGPRIFVSGCLGGHPIRYNGTGVDIQDAIWQRWSDQGLLFHFCPELAAGFGIPRPPAELSGGTAEEIIAGKRGKIIEQTGRDVTDMFLRGGELAVSSALEAGCLIAVMTDGSPSCGSTRIDSGEFKGHRIVGKGVVAQMMIDAGIPVFAHTDLVAADETLQSLLNLKH